MDWVEGHGKGDFTVTAFGRRLKGKIPATLGRSRDGWWPRWCHIAEDYPLPYFKGGS